MNIDEKSNHSGFHSKNDDLIALTEWLGNHDLLEMKDVLLKNAMSVEILSTLTDKNDIDEIASASNLTVFKKLKFQAAIRKLQTNISSTDTLSVVSGVTGVTSATGVSSIAPAFVVNDALIVILGISEFDGLPNLPGVLKDYENIINTFVNQWKYKILFKLNNNKLVYSNDIKEIEEEQKENGVKSKWSIDEVGLFVEEARKYTVKNKHNGLLFIISTHGDRGKLIYDSNCEECYLDGIFAMFSPQGSVLLESYKEEIHESNHLFQIPKIFFVDSCRGNYKAKVTHFTKNENETERKKKDTKNKEKTQQKQKQQQLPQESTTAPGSITVTDLVNDYRDRVDDAEAKRDIPEMEKLEKGLKKLKKEWKDKKGESDVFDKNLDAIDDMLDSLGYNKKLFKDEDEFRKQLKQLKDDAKDAKKSGDLKDINKAKKKAQRMLDEWEPKKDESDVIADGINDIYDILIDLNAEIDSIQKADVPIISEIVDVDQLLIDVEGESTSVRVHSVEDELEFLCKNLRKRQSLVRKLNVQENIKEVDKKNSKTKLVGALKIRFDRLIKYLKEDHNDQNAWYNSILQGLKQCCKSCVVDEDLNLATRELAIVMEKIRPFDIETMLSAFNMVNNPHMVKNRDTCLLLGRTGVGKSTTIHFLAGSTMALDPKTGHISPINVTNSDLKLIETRFKVTESVTRGISCVPIDLRHAGVRVGWSKRNPNIVTLCDAPGFDDTKGVEVDVANGLAVVRSVSLAKSVKILVILSQGDFDARMTGIRQISHTLAKMIPNFGDYPQCINFIFTKMPSNITSDILQRRIGIALDEISRNDKSDEPFEEMLDCMVDNDLIVLNPLESDRREILTKIFENGYSGWMKHPDEEFAEFVRESGRTAIYQQIEIEKLSIGKLLRGDNYKRAKYGLVKSKIKQLKRLNHVLQFKEIDLILETLLNVKLLQGLKDSESGSTSDEKDATDNMSGEELLDILAAKEREKINCNTKASGLPSGKVGNMTGPNHNNNNNNNSNNDTFTESKVNMHTSKSICEEKEQRESNHSKQDRILVATVATTNGTLENKETFRLKAVDKIEAQKVAAQMANFYTLYANIEGCSVADGSKNGGLFIRNVCSVFNDKKFVLKSTWDEMVFKIREYTKRNATLVGICNFTQLVENEGTLERPVRFDSVYIDHSGIIAKNNNTQNGNENILSNTLYESQSQFEFVIANLSHDDIIYVLLENEKCSNDRTAMFDLLVDDNDGSLFKKHGFIELKPNGTSYTFDTMWEFVFVTLFKKNSANSKNEEIYDNRSFSPSISRLYFKNGLLHSMQDLIPPCEMKETESHRMKPFDTFSAAKQNEKKMCILCNNNENNSNNCIVNETKEKEKEEEEKLNMNVSYWYCRRCNYFVCEECCHLMICNKTMVGLYVPFEISSVEQTSKATVKVEWKWTRYGKTRNFDTNNIEFDIILTHNDIKSTKISTYKILHTKNGGSCGIDVDNAWECMANNTDKSNNSLILQCKMRVMDRIILENKHEYRCSSQWIRKEILLNLNFKSSD